jgi:two-component system, NarL family, nitrate/nitrite response regulator NarL
MTKENGQRTVAVAAHEPIWGYGVRRLLEAEANLQVVAEPMNAGDAVQAVVTLRPDLLLLDIEMPPSGVDVLAKLSDAKLSVFTLMVAYSFDRKQVAETVQLGARGFVLKGSDTRVLVNGARSIMAGQYWAGDKPVTTQANLLRNFAPRPGQPRSLRDYKLTPREMEIVAAIANGCSNKDASEKFSITRRTVKHHLTNIYEKLGLSSRLELALFAVNNHWDALTAEAGCAVTNQDEYAEAS